MCYCGDIEPFMSNPEFVILIHPKETRKAINTGRMAFLAIKNSVLIVGNDVTDDPALNRILTAPNKRCFLLFPGPDAVDLSEISAVPSPSEFESQAKTDVFIILDATWTMAKKMLRLSANLQALPQVMFRPPHPSRFIIREQPGLICFSTIETIHHIIEKRGSPAAGDHHRLLQIFDNMVKKQIDYELASRGSGDA